ncbi:MAG: protein kinase [Acidimicrobiales bacterium]|nr:protein kinase [Acidimicrobiales bacterium]RZV47576.1 MAG: serine/threonine protein kinase [Acidimicrobiales bacterium]
MTEALLGDRYQLVLRVGSGGMAEVWEANDLSLGRRVAVKLLHPHLAEDPSILARFRSEAQAAARLTHPGIVAIYDTVSTDRTDAIIMELVAGRDLRSVLDERRTLTVEDAVEVALQLAQALGHAHHHGIVHRDVKPANVLVRPDRRVKISDFGIAKALDDSTFTDTGALVGTVRYLAPEQIQGNLVDGRTDLYSLTIVLYEMLCGEVPFSATDLIGAMDRMKRPAPSARSLRRDISPELEAFIAKGLERNPADRYPDARSYAAALTALQRPDATSVQPSSPAPTTPSIGAVAPTPIPSIPVRVPTDDVDDPSPAAAPKSRVRTVWPFIAALLMVVAGVVIWLLLSPLRDSVSDTLDTVDGSSDIETTTTVIPTDDTTASTGTTGSDNDNDSDDGDTIIVEEPTDTADTDEVADTTTTTAAETTTTTTAPLPDPPVVDGVAIAAFDPGGDDGLEHSDITNRAYDGDPTTFWYTQRYNSRLFGGLKGGVGLIINFDEPRTVSEINVLAGNPDWSARVYAASMPFETLDGWGEPLRFFENNPAEAVLEIPVVTAPTLLLWITDLGEPAETDDETETGVRLEVFEVAVS